MKKEILILQDEMRKYGISMYLVPTADEHQSEYISEHYKFRAYLSGFTGSAGTLLITLDECLLWTDGRYFVQAEKELENSGIILMKSGEKDVPSIAEYISSHIEKDDVLGFDGKLVSIQQGNIYRKCVENNGAKIVNISLANEVWNNRPALCYGEIRKLSFQYSGCNIKEKLNLIRAVMKEKNITVHLVSSLDDIAWIFNLRGCDIPYNPVFYSYAWISLDEVFLYVKPDVLKEEIHEYLAEEGVEIRVYESFYEDISTQIKNEKVLLNELKSAYQLYDILSESNEIVYGENPSTILKAQKNEVECCNIRKAHDTDGLIMCKFIYWIKKQMKIYSKSTRMEVCQLDKKDNSGITECDAANYLDQLRLNAPDCVDLSFDTIAAYGANAAMCHYSPDGRNPVVLKPEGFFLVDCGGQYLTGTTDVTRTIALGPLTKQQKRHYTLVLKGHIRLAMARFPKGVCGANLDILARGPLWQECLDFNHGTGHGVGYFLNVHEGPNNIHWNLQHKNGKTAPLKPGMLTSNEPGLYLEGEYGIRLENLILTKPVVHTVKQEYEDTSISDCALRMAEDDRFLEFETVTKVPFEREAIVKELLSEDEIDWLNEYHQSIYALYNNRIDEDERLWLANVTAPL